MTQLRDKIWQMVYRLAYRVLIVFCFIFRPATRGVNIAVWRDGAVLIIKNAYHPQYTLPGGYVGRGESQRAAAARELQEEVHVRVVPHQLQHVVTLEETIRYKREKLTIYETQVDPAAVVRVDNREVIWAEFLSVPQALSLNLASHVRSYLQRVQAAAA
jgi:ADP-ribose pyrophosphatase YjhB (NUDIX family)